MTTARLIIADVFEGLASLPDGCVDCVIMSPPYLRQRRYLAAGHPEAQKEIGQEQTPAEFLEVLLAVMDELWRVLSDDGTYWVNLGDKHAGSGGSGGDYNEGGLREGQPRVGKVPGEPRMRDSRRRDRAATPDYGHSRKPLEGWPLEQSVCWGPHLFGASLAYGRNILTWAEHRQWVTRPPVTWCKPNPTPGALFRTFRTATELIIYGGKHQKHYFDLDAVRYDAPAANERKTWNQTGPKQKMATDRSDERSGHARFTQRTVNPDGAPPLNWWVVGSGAGYDGAHFATFPPELLIRPVLAGSPLGGTILDPFAGSGTTLAVATGHGRDAIGIDLDERNAELALDRVGPMLLTVERLSGAVA